MRKLVLAIAMASVLALAACGSSGTSASTSASSSAEPESSQASEQVVSEEAAALDFEGSGFDEVGDGTMYVVTSGGTSEDGNVPQVAGVGDPNNSAMSIEVDYWDGDGSVCTVYVDGMENCKMNAGDVQMSITITGDALVEGVHTVEVVKMDGDTPVIYKKGQYEMVY